MDRKGNNMVINLKAARFALVFHTNVGDVRVTETKHWKRRKQVEVKFSAVEFGPEVEIGLTELWVSVIIDGEEQTALIPLDPVARDDVYGGSMGSVRYFDLATIESAFDSIDA